ncbi:peptidylprolyl isomerase [Oscillatoria amoena NRMC-F 0135]|nr:peptidylprolyl isomerase [Oscillatoria laete-virens]MDL5050556.1 peptidylprolyl isomerase [Oscillatoria amoena NRMC-F 0135]MDL5055571.1 peptidylprolyl isomerase [Oscillatoria laete-virens NRMC-F 0139]
MNHMIPLHSPTLFRLGGFSCLLLLLSACSTTPPVVRETPTKPYNPQVDRKYTFASTGDEIAVIETKFGIMVMEFDTTSAPQHVQNFKNLAGQGFYNGTLFHRVVPGFIIQGGDPKSREDKRRTEWGTGNPGYTVPSEIQLPNVRGAVAAARLGDNVNPGRESNGSQFYIVIQDAPSLDNAYTVFGQIVEGMDVADAISGQAKDKADIPLNDIPMTVTIMPRSQLDDYKRKLTAAGAGSATAR